MSFTPEGRDGSIEQELTKHQQGLVDTCLEEGHFEAAISLMDQLRSSSAKPPVSHVRQLVYIALQPEAPPVVNEVLYTDVPSSPSKSALKSRIPSVHAVVAARRLLSSYAITNLPETLARALPSYDDPRIDQPPPKSDVSLSVIGSQSMCIPNAKSCWNILAEGFTQKGQNFSLPSGKRKKRTKGHSDDEGMSETEAIVGPDAWPVLDWLLLLFEQDELLTAARGTGRFSKLLLRQIPCPRSGSGPRWDAEFPLRIVFHCLQQKDQRLQRMGSRLVTLLINISSTGLLDLAMFVSSVYSRLTAAENENLPALFSALSPSPPSHRFKVLLCQKLLADTGHSHRRDTRPQPQVRAQPRARQIRDDVKMESVSALSTSSSQSAKSALPEYAEIQRLVEMNVPPSSATMSHSFALRIKFELLNSYGMTQSVAPLAERDTAWVAALREGQFMQTLDLVFRQGDSGVEGAAFRDALVSISSIW